MPWLLETRDDGASFGVTGKSWWTRPTETFPVAAADIIEMPLPTGLVGINMRVSAVDYNGRRYRVGGWSDNTVTTEHFEMVRQGIQAPTVVPTVALSGTGLTAALICYLSYYDEKTNERSSLSAPATTLNAANQGVSWTSLPTPLDARVTHLELWRSVDGSLPRLVMRRQVGVSSVQESVATGDLGETFVESFERFPRGKVNAIYHERQFVAGDDENPDTLYLSLLNQPERWGGLTLRTRNGEPIIGLLVVRDRLIVQCPFSTYTVDGFTEDDLTMQIAQPQIGSISHHTNLVIHGLGFIWTHLGLYLTDGSGWFFLGDDVQTKWTQQYQAYRSNYEAAWAVHDPVSHVVKVYVGRHDDFVSTKNVYWVADYETVVSQVGGSYGQPRWGYDVRGRTDDCAGVLALPGGKRAEVFTGSCDGFVRRENYDTYSVADARDDDGDIWSKALEIRHGANLMADQGGDPAHGKRFTDLDVYVQSEENDWTIEVHGGSEHAWETVVGSAPIAAVDPSFTKTVTASAIVGVGVGDYTYEKLGTHSFVMPLVVGRAYTLGLTATSPRYMEYRGHDMYWKDGPAPRIAVSVINDPG